MNLRDDKYFKVIQTRVNDKLQEMNVGIKVVRDTGQINNTSIHLVKPKEKVLKGRGGPGSEAQH